MEESSSLLVDVGDVMCSVTSHVLLVAAGRPVVGSARAEEFEELGACCWTMPCTNFRSKSSWQSGFEFVTCSGYIS